MHRRIHVYREDRDRDNNLTISNALFPRTQFTHFSPNYSVNHSNEISDKTTAINHSNEISDKREKSIKLSPLS
jgi:hypothetical protein